MTTELSYIEEQKINITIKNSDVEDGVDFTIEFNPKLINESSDDIMGLSEKEQLLQAIAYEMVESMLCGLEGEADEVRVE